jgi:hypothetical protein
MRPRVWYKEIASEANLYDLEEAGKKAVSYRDFAELMHHWLDVLKWP